MFFFVFFLKNSHISCIKALSNLFVFTPHPYIKNPSSVWIDGLSNKGSNHSLICSALYKLLSTSVQTSTQPLELRLSQIKVGVLLLASQTGHYPHKESVPKSNLPFISNTFYKQTSSSWLNCLLSLTFSQCDKLVQTHCWGVLLHINHDM